MLLHTLSFVVSKQYWYEVAVVLACQLRLGLVLSPVAFNAGAVLANAPGSAVVVVGVTAADRAELGLNPAAFTASTLNVYLTADVNPVKMRVGVAEPTRRLVPPVTPVGVPPSESNTVTR